MNKKMVRINAHPLFGGRKIMKNGKTASGTKPETRITVIKY